MPWDTRYCEAIHCGKEGRPMSCELVYTCILDSDHLDVGID